MKTIKRSEEIWKRAIELIPAGTQSLSKSPTSFVDGVAPKYVYKADGCIMTDVDGNDYIDFGMALGPIVLGYNNPNTNNAIINQLNNGIIFSLLNPLELELAEVLNRLIPCAEMVRFGKNGSDATTIAVRVARACTGRDKIICCGYHGWHDWFIGTTERKKGIPDSTSKLTLKFEYNDIESLKKIFSENRDQIAGVIMEPVHAEEPEEGFLHEVKKVCHENDALFILDEIKMGFRIAMGGGQEYYDVVPDLAAFGKSMANGMPISVLVGKKEFMKELHENVFYSFTFAGETLSLAASLATIAFMEKNEVIAHLWNVGNKLKNGLNQIVKENGIEKYIRCVGLGPYTTVNFYSQSEDPLVVKSLFMQECIKRGVMFGGYHIMCFAHKEEIIDKTLSVYEEAASIVRKAIDNNDVAARLEGKPIRPVFKRL